MATTDSNSVSQRPPLSVTTLAMYEAQDVFDHIVNHLRKQGEPALVRADGHSVCAYLTPDGRKCAAGSLFTPDEYKIGYEDKPWGYLVATGAIPSAHANLIGVLQAVHDDDHDSGVVLQVVHDDHDHGSVGRWERAFKKVAADFNLVYTSPDRVGN